VHLSYGHQPAAVAGPDWRRGFLDRLKCGVTAVSVLAGCPGFAAVEWIIVERAAVEWIIVERAAVERSSAS
jgi:hypothetical protein